ncbi:ubiquitin-like-specific protease 1D isoform X2 [Phragmites australis]|uniref:ubiquitin-like-specific protease 1D isoform X2 n=1 Tax=Phragmites australis TaxID=29695 RepID=UPI002D78A6F5|nr:ubiquitin-like-specific protease 1D isoform X2 [Phragmites australis]
MASGHRRLEIDWEEVLGGDRCSSPDRVDVCFAASSSAPAARAAAAKGKREGDTAGTRRPHPVFEGLRSGRRALLEPRPGIDAAAKAADGFGWDARSAADKAYTWGIEDERGESASLKYCVKSSPIRCRKKNYGQLDMKKKERSLRHAGVGQRKPISVDKMYSSKPCSTTLSGHQQRVHAIDPEEADHERCWQSENHNFSYFTKRRKEQHQDSSPHFQKVEDVVLLDDEDIQPEKQVECGIPGKQNESKIYYPSRDDPEAVELTSSDISCLDPGVYLSSPVINYYIQYIKRTKLPKEDCRDKFYIFNTYFYSKLEEALCRKGDFLKLRRWWKGVNIYHRAYIILPIHGMAHWSLIIVCIPAKESNSGPIILHLDSLGMHPSTKIFNTVERYLEAEWCHLKKNPPPDTSISQSIWEDLPRNIHTEKVQVPQQNNAYDCGIFMLYYIERFIREAPERLTRDKLDMFSCSWFNSEDASELRLRIRALLLEEFESARLDDAMLDTTTSDASGIEDSMKGGELEAITPSDSSEMIVEGVEFGDTGKNNEGFKVTASEEASGESGYTGKSNEDITEVAALDKAPTSSSRREEKTVDCVLSEAATFCDSVEGEEETVKADSDISKTEEGEEEFVILSPERSKNNEGIINSTPIPDVVCDSCDSDTDDVMIIEVPNRRGNWRNCCIS